MWKSIHRFRRYRAETNFQQTNRPTDKLTPIYPPNFVCGGIIRTTMIWWWTSLTRLRPVLHYVFYWTSVVWSELTGQFVIVFHIKRQGFSSDVRWSVRIAMSAGEGISFTLWKWRRMSTALDSLVSFSPHSRDINWRRVCISAALELPKSSFTNSAQWAETILRRSYFILIALLGDCKFSISSMLGTQTCKAAAIFRSNFLVDR